MKSRLEIGEKRDNEVSVWTVAIGWTGKPGSAVHGVAKSW